ncbi:hypothetical protein DUI87_18731 [Hirundo rustica rustica]|uniref:CCHC-type domain-containing protein n=1 Tax=Hirundo rustica rustica TaxID=333673 RepID=A0A3M0JXK3_HIRRU|nr:hypothetical protein DUI87_18731 [Hirundo rustica rustica]
MPFLYMATQQIERQSSLILSISISSHVGHFTFTQASITAASVLCFDLLGIDMGQQRGEGTDYTVKYFQLSKMFIPLDDILSFRHVNYTTKLGVICKFTEAERQAQGQQALMIKVLLKEAAMPAGKGTLWDIGENREESNHDGPEEDPFDPGPIDPEKEPDLYPLNLHDNWLMGTGPGPYSDPAAQARDCAREAFDGAWDAAHQAFLKVADVKTLQKAFTTIAQGPQEPYMQFVDRLKQALERQIDNADTREILLLKLAVENANTDCKKLLKSLPNQQPSLVKMVEACNRIGTIEHQYESLATVFTAAKGLSGTSAVCYGCGKPGHLKKDYSAQKGGKPKIPDVCPQCHKGCHFAKQCGSKYDSEGRPVQGNQNQSAGQCQALTQILQPPTQIVPPQMPASRGQPPRMHSGGPSQVFTQQLQGAPDWTWQPQSPSK